MGTVSPLAWEFLPNAQAYNARAQRAAVEYLTNLSIYGTHHQVKLRYRFGIRDTCGKLVTLTIEYSLEGKATNVSLVAHYQTGYLSRQVSERLLGSMPTSEAGSNTEAFSIGELICLWQLQLHELLRSNVEWELWEYYLDNEETAGWAQSSSL